MKRLRSVYLASLLFTVCLAGCPVTVSMSDLGSFGSGSSGVWLELEIEPEQGEGIYYNGFLVHNQAGLCDAIQGTYDELATVADEMALAQEEGRTEDECDAARRYQTTLQDSLGSFHGPGANLMEIPFFDASGSYTVPGEGVWQKEGTDPSFHLGLYLFEEDYFEVAKEEIEYVDSECWWSTDAGESAYEFHRMGSGTVTVEHRVEGEIHLHADVELFPAEGGNPPHLTARGSFTHCPVQVTTERAWPDIPPWMTL